MLYLDIAISAGEIAGFVFSTWKERMICEDHIHLTAAGIEAVAEQTSMVLREVLK